MNELILSAVLTIVLAVGFFCVGIYLRRKTSGQTIEGIKAPDAGTFLIAVSGGLCLAAAILTIGQLIIGS